MAPEIVRDKNLHKKPTFSGEKADIYALGAVFYRFIYGCSIFLDEELKSMRDDGYQPELPSHLTASGTKIDNLLKHLVDINPVARWTAK